MTCFSRNNQLISSCLLIVMICQHLLCSLPGLLKGQTRSMQPFHLFLLSIFFSPSKAALQSHPCSDVRLSCIRCWEEKLLFLHHRLLMLDSLCNLGCLYNDGLKLDVTGAPRATRGRALLTRAHARTDTAGGRARRSLTSSGGDLPPPPPPR